MRIGFANIYSWRPHVHHLVYLARLAEQGGHETAFLTCDSSVSDCYTRLLRGRSRLRECSTCIAGGVRSFPVSNVTSISRIPSRLNIDALDRLALSSSCTLTRTESDAEWNDPPVVEMRQWLHDAVGAAYESALRWIDRERLDAVVCFNGRMDMTAAVLMACEAAGIPYVTHERSGYGDGIYCVPNGNCLSTHAIGPMFREYRDKPLTGVQAALAGKLLAQRFLGRNTLDWRRYNTGAVSATWPLAGSGPRVLVLPSSRNEFAGLEERRSEWTDNNEALDDFMEAFDIKAEQVVVRCHPGWAERVGKVDGSRSLEHTVSWCAARGIMCIPSSDNRSTYDLIEEADIIVVNGSTAGIEAAARGKKVYCLGPAYYQESGCVQIIRGPSELGTAELSAPMEPAGIVRKTLRYIYVNARRYPQFIDHVRADNTTQYRYFDGADPDRLTRLLTTGSVGAEDPAFSEDDAAETEIVDAMMASEWSRLASFEEVRQLRPSLKLERRRGMRWIDSVRGLMPRGDRG